MTNTHTEVVIPRSLAHDLKTLLIELEDFWYRRGDEEKLSRVQDIASELVSAEELYGPPASEQDDARLRELIPGP